DAKRDELLKAWKGLDKGWEPPPRLEQEGLHGRGGENLEYSSLGELGERGLYRACAHSPGVGLGLCPRWHSSLDKTRFQQRQGALNLLVLIWGSGSSR